MISYTNKRIIQQASFSDFSDITDGYIDDIFSSNKVIWKINLCFQRGRNISLYHWNTWYLRRYYRNAQINVTVWRKIRPSYSANVLIQSYSHSELSKGGFISSGAYYNAVPFLKCQNTNCRVPIERRVVMRLTFPHTTRNDSGFPGQGGVSAGWDTGFPGLFDNDK